MSNNGLYGYPPHYHNAIPSLGKPGQVLTKNSQAEFDIKWADPAPSNVPSGTGFVHVTGGGQDPAARALIATDIPLLTSAQLPTDTAYKDAAQSWTANQTFTKQLGVALLAVTYASSLTLNWNNGSVQAITLTGNLTLAFSNPIAGFTYIVQLIQDATGGRTVTWPTMKWAGGTAPTLSLANKKDIITIFFDGADYCASAMLNC